jgi:hypothetical protein
MLNILIESIYSKKELVE